MCAGRKMDRKKTSGSQREKQKEYERAGEIERERRKEVYGSKNFGVRLVYILRFFDSLSQYNDDESESNERLWIEKFRKTTEIISIFFIAQDKREK